MLQNKLKAFAKGTVLVTALSATALTSAFAQLSNGTAGQVRELAVEGSASFTSKTLPQVSSTWTYDPAEAEGRLPLVSEDVVPLTLSAEGIESGVSGAMGAPSVGSQAHGTASEQWPYAHSRAAIYGNPGSGLFSFQIPVTSRPYRFSGKLFMRFGSSTFVCSASLVRKGVLITAAHCVHNYGQGSSGFADEVTWVPGHYNSNGGAYGVYSATDIIVPSPYVNGTDTCQNGANGIVCNNDIATVLLPQRNNLWPGAAMGGWYNWGWNNYGFVSSPAFGNNTVAAITQLGYPVAWDNGFQKQRNDSFGKYITTTNTVNSQLLENTQLGSPLSGGSSGGPWLVNFGTYPVATNSDATYGSAAQRNTVIGTTSWGYINPALNVQGASHFGQNVEFPNAAYGGYGAGNIGALMQTTCTTYAAYC